MPRKTVAKSLPVSFRLAPEVKKAAEKAAKNDTRSLSSFMERVLVEHLRANGYLEKAVVSSERETT